VGLSFDSKAPYFGWVLRELKGFDEITRLLVSVDRKRHGTAFSLHGETGLPRGSNPDARLLHVGLSFDSKAPYFGWVLRAFLDAFAPRPLTASDTELPSACTVKRVCRGAKASRKARNTQPNLCSALVEPADSLFLAATGSQQSRRKTSARGAEFSQVIAELVLSVPIPNTTELKSSHGRFPMNGSS
jgi:hypothetical protein